MKAEPRPSAGMVGSMSGSGWRASLRKLSSQVGSREAAVRKWSVFADVQSCSNGTVLGPKGCFDEPDDWFPALLCLAPQSFSRAPLPCRASPGPCSLRLRRALPSLIKQLRTLSPAHYFPDFAGLNPLLLVLSRSPTLGNRMSSLCSPRAGTCPQGLDKRSDGFSGVPSGAPAEEEVRFSAWSPPSAHSVPRLWHQPGRVVRMLGSHRGRNAEPLALGCPSYRGDPCLQVGKRDGLTGVWPGARLGPRSVPPCRWQLPLKRNGWGRTAGEIPAPRRWE